MLWQNAGQRKVVLHALLRRARGAHPAIQNPTLVVLTDRNDLDDQLFGQFQRCADILCQTPAARSEEGLHHLRGCDEKVPFIDFIEQRLKSDPVARKILATRRRWSKSSSVT